MKEVGLLSIGCAQSVGDVVLLGDMEEWEEVGEWLAGLGVSEVDGVEGGEASSWSAGSKYFIIVIRCQPGISCCGGSGCRIPLQWYGSASVPEPMKCW